MFLVGNDRTFTLLHIWSLLYRFNKVLR